MDRAPDFTLPDHEDRPWRLGEAVARGPVLLVFYRGDWWPYCNGQLASYARMWDRFESAGLAVAGISVDSVKQNAAMVEKLLLPFPLLSDPNGDVIRSYGIWSDGEGGIARPSLFLIEPGGAIRFTYVGEDFADRPSDDELFTATAGVGKG